MAPNHRVKTRYPAHIDPEKLPPNIGFDPRWNGRWYIRDRQAKKEYRLGDASMSVSDIWDAVRKHQAPKGDTFRGISELFQKSEAWRKLKPPTQKDYSNCHVAICDRETDLDLLLGDYPLESWTKGAIHRWMDARSAESQVRMEHEFRYMKRVFRWSLDREYASSNPTREVRLVTVKRDEDEDRYITDEELTAAICVAPLKIALLATLAWITGRRKTDLISMSKSQDTLEGLAFKESKTGKRTYVPWVPELRDAVDMLTSLAPKNSTMIVDYKETSFDTAWQRVRQNLRAKGVKPFKFKELRAKHATDFDAQGGDATKNLQHSTRALTDRHYLKKARKVTPLRTRQGQ